MRGFKEKRWGEISNDAWHTAKRVRRTADELEEKAKKLESFLKTRAESYRNVGLEVLAQRVEDEIKGYFDEVSMARRAADKSEEMHVKTREKCRNERINRREGGSQ